MHVVYFTLSKHSTSPLEIRKNTLFTAPALLTSPLIVFELTADAGIIFATGVKLMLANTGGRSIVPWVLICNESCRRTCKALN